jgi:hypothetical protein
MQTINEEKLREKEIELERYRNEALKLTEEASKSRDELL